MELIIFIGALAIVVSLEIIAGVSYIKKRDKKIIAEFEEEKDSQKNNLLCRFVLDGVGRKIGESVAIDEDIMIIKTGSKYLGVPMKHIEEEEKTLLVKGLVDHDKAEEMGEEWRQNSLNKMKIQVEEGGKDERF